MDDERHESREEEKMNEGARDLQDGDGHDPGDEEKQSEDESHDASRSDPTARLVPGKRKWPARQDLPPASTAGVAYCRGSASGGRLITKTFNLP